MISTKIPIVYHSNYNIHLYGLENILHSFDSKKYGKVFDRLCERNTWNYDNFSHPESPISDEDLLLVHSKRYIDSVVSSSSEIAKITEVPFLSLIPMWVARPRLLQPMKLACEGTILATSLAMSHGWAINLSGGYHHAKPDNGEGFCIYADVSIAIRKFLGSLFHHPMIIDLDAHQGNGYVSAFADVGSAEGDLTYTKHSNIKIFDMYNADVYPRDSFARDFIDYDFPLRRGTATSAYLTKLKKHLSQALTAAKPDIVFYNAGSDILQGDPIGALGVSAEGIIERDEEVFRHCRERHIPIVMVLSGGYTQQSSDVIFRSIQNLLDKGIISLPVTSS